MKGALTHEPSESNKWKNWVETEDTSSLRWDMMNDLRNDHELIGKSKLEIIELLGEADNHTRLVFRYNLGYSKRGITTAIYAHVSVKDLQKIVSPLDRIFDDRVLKNNKLAAPSTKSDMRDDSHIK
jgi:hypothetical protein